MKRLRIWLNSFDLLQQFLAIIFLTAAFFVAFIVTFLNYNIDTFVNNQMYAYLHKSQSTYIQVANSDDSNVSHYIYSTKENKYLSNILDEDKEVIAKIDLNEDNADSYVTVHKIMHTYSTTSLNDDQILVSIIDDDYRSSYKSSLMDAVINTTFLVIFGLFMIFLIWMGSLIRPLKQIKNYIERIKKGEEASITFIRHDEIGEVAEALTSMHDELDKQNRIKEEMIQNISHDLKTPIAIIKSYSESIIDGVYPYGTLNNSVNVILEHANRLEKKVYSLLTLNRIGYLQDTSEGDNLLMNEIVEKVVSDSKALNDKIEINVVSNRDVYFHGEEEPWRIVVENLVDNALRYAKSVITITLEKNSLEVYDDGEKMDKERLEKLFKPYEKGSKGKFGLGLSIVKRISETYGYKVTGENMNDGVVFKIYRNEKKKKTSKKAK